MTLSKANVTKLSRIPNIKFLLLKAALKQSSYDPQGSPHGSLPNNKICFEGFALDNRNLRLFHQVVGWDPESDSIHPCYLHSLAFPMHIMLLLLPEFPFPLLGLVHINNQICQVRPIKKDETLSVSCCFDQLSLHPKGWLFSIKVAFYSGSELVWQSISTNLFRCKHGHNGVSAAKYSMDTFANAINTNWQLSANLGRRYAKVSGDFNPIHLSKWSAKLFGFNRHIIHGMWTKSYCISALEKINPRLFSQGFEINTRFKQPLYLPSQVNLAVQTLESEGDGMQHFKVVGTRANNKPHPLHLIGHIRSI